MSRTTLRILSLFVVLILFANLYIAMMLFDRSWIREMAVQILGDRSLKNTLIQYRAKIIPENSIYFKAPSIGSNISVSWAFRQEYVISTYPLPIVDDVDQDGRPEVYISSYSKNVYALDGASGKQNWKWHLPFGVTGGRVMYLTNLCNNGHKQLIFGTHTTLPIRVYALKTGKNDDKNRLLWAKNLSGDFLEGGLNIFERNRVGPLIVTATRDAPYSRGTYTVLNSGGKEIYKPMEGFDNCISRPAIGLLSVSRDLSVIHGSHAFYNAKYGFRITANSLSTGRILWISPKIGDTGFENHQIVDINFDGENEVIAYARQKDKIKTFILKSNNGSIIKEVPWVLQGIDKKKRKLFISLNNRTLGITPTNDTLFKIPCVSFGLVEKDSTFLFSIGYKNNYLTIDKYDGDSGKLLKHYFTYIHLGLHQPLTDYGKFVPDTTQAAFLTLADTNNDGKWDLLLQIADYVVNVKTPFKVFQGFSKFATNPFRNTDNSGIIYSK